jgi:hypothetical protein
MTEHDPIKAASEELSGMQDAWKVLHVMVRDAERRASEAEVQLNSLLKVRAVFGDDIERRQAELNVLRKAKEQAAKT